MQSCAFGSMIIIRLPTWRKQEATFHGWPYVRYVSRISIFQWRWLSAIYKSKQVSFYKVARDVLVSTNHLLAHGSWPRGRWDTPNSLISGIYHCLMCGPYVWAYKKVAPQRVFFFCLLAPIMWNFTCTLGKKKEILLQKTKTCPFLTLS